MKAGSGRDTNEGDKPIYPGQFEFYRGKDHFSERGLGLTKREYFAGLVLASLLPGNTPGLYVLAAESEPDKYIARTKNAAVVALTYADALLEELAK